MSSFSHSSETSSGSRPIFILRAFLLLTTLEGIFALATTISTPSMEQRAFLFGYSLPKLLLIAVLFIILFVFASLTLKACLDSNWPGKFLARINLSANPSSLALLIFFSLYAGITLGFVLFLARGGFVAGPFILLAAIERLFGFLSWTSLILLQLALMLILIYIGQLKDIWTGEAYNKAPLLFLIITITSIQWIALGLRASLFYEIPDWFWHFGPPKKFQLASIYIPATGIITLLGIIFILRKPRYKILNLCIAIALAYILQVGFGFANGKGFESLRLKYVKTLLSAETRLICSSKADVITTIKSYDQLYGKNFWLGTKPPGLAVFFTGIRDLIAKLAPEYVVDEAGCLETLTNIYAVTFPLLAALTLVPLRKIENLLGESDNSALSGLLYISAPNFILMTLVRDQFLYPLVFILTVWIMIAAAAKPSLAAGLTAGICIYITIFVSFSLLPLIGMGVAWIIGETILLNKPTVPKNLMSALFGMGLGFVVIWLGFHYFLNYSPLTRFQLAIHSHQRIQDITPSPANIIRYGFLNNTEFLIWSGAPLILLAATGSFRSLAALIKRTHTRRDVFILACAVIYLTLNLMGQTKAEVGRLWIFLLPLAGIAASGEAASLFGNTRQSFLLVFALQFITTTLTFFFFDFH
jgi:hypothetical protein